MASKKRVILSGMRPTGKLHLGNWVGALSNWIKLENEPETECFYMVADWHALTTDYEDPSSIENNIEEMVLDWLARGRDSQLAWINKGDSLIFSLASLSIGTERSIPMKWQDPVFRRF